MMKKEMIREGQVFRTFKEFVEVLGFEYYSGGKQIKKLEERASEIVEWERIINPKTGKKTQRVRIVKVLIDIE